MNDNPFQLSPKERRQEWRQFRLCDLDKNMSDEEHLQMVVDWWSPAPLSTRYIDPYKPSEWPTGWELVINGNICDYSIAIGMEQTLLLREGRWTSERVHLALINDAGEMKLVVIVDNKWVLNKSYAEIVDITAQNNVFISKKYTFDGHTHQ